MNHARERIRNTIEHWYLCEPLFLAVWTVHTLVRNPRIHSIRVHQGRVEYNPEFIEALSQRDLRQVLQFEAMRMVLKHPYTRRQENAQRTYLASNITLQELLSTDLPVPSATDVLGTQVQKHAYFEYYYACLAEQQQPVPSTSVMREDILPSTAPLAAYANSALSGAENTEHWGSDEWLVETLNEKIHHAQSSHQWGSLAGRYQEKILASLKPRLNYRAVLQQFRTTVLSSKRVLTRLKPSRRYGFLCLGSRRDYSTRLLVAVDVSGSMHQHELANGFSVVNQLFRYGVESIDVIQFDTQIQGDVLSLQRAKQDVVVLGRGGTCFQPVIDYIDQHRQYDGLIVFTDGDAPIPSLPRNRKTRLLWLFNNESRWGEMQLGLRRLGLTAYLQVSG